MVKSEKSRVKSKTFPQAFLTLRFSPFTLHCLLLFTIYHLRFTCFGSLYLQTSDLARDCCRRYPARVRRSLAGDLDALSSLPFSQISRHNCLAAGNDSPTPGQ